MIRSVKSALGIKVKPIPKKVIYLPISKLNFEAKTKLAEKLDKLKKNTADALLVGINVGPANSQSNRLTQADLIGKMLKAKAKDLGVPLITYAEEMTFMHGMHLLMFGDHILANEVSMLGNIGSRFTPYYTKDFIQDWHVRMRYVHHG